MQCIKTSERWALNRLITSPRATEYVGQMLDMIGKSWSKKAAYRASNGDVNYAVRKFEGYMASCQASRWTNCVRVNASRSTTASKTRLTSCCGRRLSRRAADAKYESTFGAGDLAGTSSARP